MRKLEVAQESGADTVMDLSIAGDLVAIRKDMLSRTPLPLGTVPLYSVAQRYIDRDRDPADIDPEELFAEVEMQAEQGVDFMTLHCGLTRRGAEWAARGERAPWHRVARRFDPRPLDAQERQGKPAADRV